MKKNILLFVNMLLPFVVFAQTLTSVNPSNANSGQTLDVTITGQNTHFTATGNKVIFGFSSGSTTSVVNSITPLSDTQLKVNVTVPKSVLTGYYSVTASNSIDTNIPSLPGAIHITNLPSSTLVGIVPSNGKAGQTLDVTITGKNTHFKAAGTNEIGFGFFQGSGTTIVNSMDPINDSTLKANITIPSKTYDGNYGVSVSNSIDGVPSLINAFEITGNPRPFIVSLQPASAKSGTTLDVLITGKKSHFTQGTNLVRFGFSSGSGIVNSTSVINDTLIKVNINIPSYVGPGNYGVEISNSMDGNFGGAYLHVLKGINTAIVAVNPAGATTGQTLDVSITGTNTHFKSAGSTVAFGFFAQASGTTIINSLNAVHDSLLVVNMTVPATIQTGDYDVSVEDLKDGMIRLISGFHISGSPPPTIFSATPATFNAGQTVDVTIVGQNTHFSTTNNTTVVFYVTTKSGSNINIVNSLTIINETTLKANITIPADAYTGKNGFIVSYASGGGSIPVFDFYVNGISLPIGISGNPSGVLANETVNMTIRGVRGTHFNQPGSKTTVKFVGNRTIIINSKTVVNDSVINLNITTPAIDGGYRMYVNDSIDGEIMGFFKVYSKCGALFTTTYDASTDAFILTLDSATSKAKSFHWDFGDGTTSTDSFPSHVFPEDKIYNVCLQISNAVGDSCRSCHEMGKDSLGNPIFKKIGFSLYAKPYKEVVLGISTIDNNEHFLSVYPNPADNFITVVSTTPINALNKPVLSIYSIEGKLLLQQAFVKEKMTLDVSSFRKGVYIMQLTGSKQTEIIKFTKE